jgi:uncharacterized protein (TIGR02246 family)
MSTQPAWNAQEPGGGENPVWETQVRAAYDALLDAWNRRSAEDFAALFAPDGNVVGFDGTPVDGKTEIEAHLRQIFESHQTAAYVGKIREVRLLTDDIVFLRAVAGMVPPGGTDLNPDANAVQSLVAVRRNAQWRIALYHNTPAAFHGRPEASQALTDELRQLLTHRGTAD